jgi:hypothetical protein
MFATEDVANCTILEIKSAPGPFPKGPTHFIADLLFLVSSAEDIIHADLVIVRQGAEDVRRHHALAVFVISVGALRYIDGLAHLLLCQIGILAQVADALILFHIYHHAKYN